MGFDVIQDDAHTRNGHGAGNIIATLKGTLDVEPIYFTVHMDTVVPGKGIKPEIREDGYIYSDGTTILGADDKAGMAALFEMARRLKEQNIAARNNSIHHYCRGRKWFGWCKRIGSTLIDGKIWFCSR